MTATLYTAIGMPGIGEWLVILVIVVIFFGVGRLPEVLGQMGKGVRAFKDGMNSNDDAARPKQINVDDAEEVRPTKSKTTSSVDDS